MPKFRRRYDTRDALVLVRSKNGSASAPAPDALHGNPSGGPETPGGRGDQSIDQYSDGAGQQYDACLGHGVDDRRLVRLPQSFVADQQLLETSRQGVFATRYPIGLGRARCRKRRCERPLVTMLDAHLTKPRS